MQRTMMKSKIHRATVTGADLDYEGSITIDKKLLEQADILPGEQVQVVNINNGSRFYTYTIEAPEGSGTVLLNGPAARLAYKGDIIIIISYCRIEDKELPDLKTRVLLMDENNKPKEIIES